MSKITDKIETTKASMFAPHRISLPVNFPSKPMFNMMKEHPSLFLFCMRLIEGIRGNNSESPDITEIMSFDLTKCDVSCYHRETVYKYLSQLRTSNVIIKVGGQRSKLYLMNPEFYHKFTFDQRRYYTRNKHKYHCFSVCYYSSN